MEPSFENASNHFSTQMDNIDSPIQNLKNRQT